MTDPAARLLAAEADVAMRRERVAATLGDLKGRLNPRRIVRHAVADVSAASETAALAGVETVRRYPATLAGIGAAGGLFLLRHRIARLVRRATRRSDRS